MVLGIWCCFQKSLPISAETRPPATFPGVRHMCPGLGLSWLALAWELGSVVGIKAHLRMLRDILGFLKFIWRSQNCPVLTFVVSLVAARRHQGGGESLENGKGGGERGTPGDPRFSPPSSLFPGLIPFLPVIFNKNLL